MTKYGVVVVDYPWFYDDAGIRGGTGKHYEGVSSELGLKLPISDLAADSAHLYVWTTNSFLIDGTASAFARSWGFRPVQLVTWCKSRIGTGHHFRNTTEHVVFATRGDKVRGSASLPTHFYWPLSEHSQKPVEFYRKVVEKMSDGPYLDVFARERKPGWDAWGHVAGGGISHPALDAWSAEAAAEVAARRDRKATGSARVAAGRRAPPSPRGPG